MASTLHSQLSIAVKPAAGTYKAPAELSSIDKTPESCKLRRHIVRERSLAHKPSVQKLCKMVRGELYEKQESQVTQVTYSDLLEEHECCLWSRKDEWDVLVTYVIDALSVTFFVGVKLGHTSSCNTMMQRFASASNCHEDDESEYGDEPLVSRETVNQPSFRESLMRGEVSLRKLLLGEILGPPARSMCNIFLEFLESFPQKSPEKCSKKKLLILDINGLLADIVYPAPKGYKADTKIAGRAIFKRPACSDFLKFCLERFDVAVWSSRSKKVLDRVVEYLFGDLKHKLVFCWDLSYCTKSKFRALENPYKPLIFKELKKIWGKCDPDLPWEKGDYDESNTLLLDDSPYKALLNPPHTAIFPFTYNFRDGEADDLIGPGGSLRAYLEELAKAENAQEYIRSHPFGQEAITEQNLYWPFYQKVLKKQFAVAAEPNNLLPF